MKIDHKKVDLFYDLMDKACMIYYHDLKYDYIKAFIKVSSDITSEFDEGQLSEGATRKLNKIYKQIENNSFVNEEIRLALELVLIKGYKHLNVALDFFTPDVINYLFAYIVNTINGETTNNIIILDTVLGSGNLLQTIINNAACEVSGVGIEWDELNAGVALACTNLLDNKLIVNCQDAKDHHHHLVDMIVGDFGESADVCSIILERLNNLSSGYFIYLVNNDLFRKSNNEFLDQLRKEATLLGLIVLPKTFVSSDHVGKSILIGKKEVLANHQMKIVQIDDTLNQENIRKVLDKINMIIKN